MIPVPSRGASLTARPNAGPAATNFQGVLDRADISGKTLSEQFAVFCQMAKIEFTGSFESLEEEPS